MPGREFRLLGWAVDAGFDGLESMSRRGLVSGSQSPVRARRQAPKMSGETLESLDHYGRRLFLTVHPCARSGLCSSYTSTAAIGQ
nr:hypothetical protein [Rhodospirillales bacterium]